MNFVIFIINLVGETLLWVLVAIVFVKVVWNLGLPYAMARGPHGKGWSIFPLVEFVPLLLAILVSFLLGDVTSLSPRHLFIYGTLAIVGSYVHLIVMLMVLGWWKSRSC